MDELNTVQRLAVWALPVLMAITVHEVAHGWVAKKLGDPTAQMMGRLTLNPLKHIDPVGTILLPAVLLVLGGFIFGWAKPVPITWENLKNPRRDVALVAIAGPGANFLMAVVWALIMKVSLVSGVGSGGFAYPLILMAQAGITINVILMILNLVPIPPLDGGRVLGGMLPGRLAWQFSRIEPFGIWILLALLISGVLASVMSGPVQSVLGLMYAIARV